MTDPKPAEAREPDYLAMAAAMRVKFHLHCVCTLCEGMQVNVLRQAFAAGRAAALREAREDAKDAAVEERWLCSGGVNPGFGPCPRCGATADDSCPYDAPQPSSPGDT